MTDIHATSDNAVTTLRELIDLRARLQPTSLFLIDPETRRAVSYQELADYSILLSTQLMQAGLSQGDKIAFLLDNGLSAVQLFLGTMYGGFTAVPLNVRAGLSALSYMLQHCDAKIVVVGVEYAALIEEVMAGVQNAVKVIHTGSDGSPVLSRSEGPGALPKESNPGDEALLMYTSGSTGRPKAAVHSHSTVLAQGRNSIASNQLTQADRSLLILPLYHINAECVTVVPTLLSGGSIVVPSRFQVSKFWDLLDEFQCTWSALVPTIISQLLDWEDPRASERQAALKRIRFLRSSSASLAPSLHREFLEKFKLILIQAMGSTEAGNIFSNPLPPGENKIGSPGLPWGFEARIVDRAGGDVVRGESGEVLIRGQAVMKGYYKDPVETSAVIDADGWLHTGDLAYQDQDGYFFVMGRARELIIKGGVNISPRQIDDVLESHPAVLEAAAIGMPDRYVGEDIIAFAVLRAGSVLTEKALLDFCEKRLGPFKTPTRIHLVADLPKGPSGKIQRLRLADRVAGLASLAVSLPESATSLNQGTPVPDRIGLANEPASIEQVIACIWSEILGQPQIDIRANFFALGGHSLLAIQCLSRLREKLPIVMSLSDFFEHPSVARQAALIKNRLWPEGAPIGDEIAVLLASAGDSRILSPDRIMPRNRALPCPLSAGQQPLWFLEQLNPGLPVYNESEAVELKGELNVAAMEQALNAIIARHEILRSTIRATGEQPVVIVHERWPLRLKEIDLGALTIPLRQTEFERLLIAEPQRLYHLDAEPGIRATLLHLSSREHVFILMMHHLVCDWASLGVIWRELSVHYRAFSRGESPALPPLPIQYGDYAVWQKEQMTNGAFSVDLAYWKEKLLGAHDLLELPTDRPRPPVITNRGARLRFRIGSTLVQSLRECSRRESISLFSLFTAVLNTLLYRYTGSEDILIGIPLADRDRTELQSLIGFLLHTHVLRTHLAGEMKFRDLLARVQNGVSDLYSHRAPPFYQVVSQVQTKRNLSYSPLFQVMVNWRDRDQQLTFIGMDGLVVKSLLAETRTSKFDLTWMFTDDGDDIWLEMEYSTDLFNEARIERMVGHYQTLLKAVSEDTGRRLAELPLLTEGERHQLLVEWNDTAVDYPRDKCIHELFEEQVEKTPEALAVIFENEQLTYRELNGRANRLAHHLRGLGVGPDVLVGICVDRSLEMVVGLLGILKAGGAYVPLDPAYPQERLAFVVEDTALRVLVTQNHLIPLLPSHQAAVVVLDAGFPAVEIVHPPTGQSSRNLAYVIYTSGSTGRPKGVAIEHRNAVALIHWAHQTFTMKELSGVLASTSICFDLSVFELFVPLTRGGGVILAENVLQLPELAAAGQVTLINSVPSGVAELLRFGKIPSSVVTVNLAGEPLKTSLVRDIYRQGTVQRVYDLYGPSEDTTYSTFCLRQAEGVETIGRPLSNKQVYILNEDRQPVPVGVAGELYIGGAGVARGYLNRPELTAEKFVVNPFGDQGGGRLYRTGDLCRYLPDGNIEFLGRMDQQVKIRGFRIELGEIEATLVLHAGVRQTVVVAREEGDGDKRLVAYVVAVDPSSPPGVAELRDFLKLKLPRYMVPAAFVMLEHLPLTSNGKVDRKALPAPELTREPGRQGYVGPRTPTEEALADIWAEVLKIREVGVHDNFFELGGHSLLATQVVARIRRVLAVEVPLRDLFEFPTIAEIAQEFPALQGAADSSVPPLLPALRGQPMPPSFAQQRLWFLDRFEGSSIEYNISKALRLEGDLDREALARAINGIVARHESLRTHFVETEDGLIQVVEPELRIEMPVEDLSALETGLQEKTLAASLRHESEVSFDLSKGPLLRAKLFVLGEREHILLWTCHHIVSDGWSQGVFSLELAALYASFRDKKASDLPELPVQYADYAVWQRGWLQGEELERQLGYWREQLNNPPILELPSDRSRPSKQTYAGAQHSFVLSDELAVKLKAFNHAENITPFMSLMGVFQVLLSRYSGQEDIVVGTPIANRQREELENLIGFFVNTLVLRTDLSGQPSFREVVRRVRRTALDAYQHQDLPFEKLVEQLNPARDLSRHPIFQAMFALQNAPVHPLNLAGLEMSPHRFPAYSTHFDLELHLWAAGETWSGSFSYNTDLFDAATIERMAGHFQRLLESMLAEPERPVSAVPLLTERERHQLLVEWNDTAVDYPRDKCIHQLFEEQVERSPEAVAVVFEKQELSYRELNERANQLAHHLRGMGVGPEVLVGICVERSLEMVVGLLGILKAGGAYVPLDPSYPKERLAFILEDTALGILVTQKKLISLLPATQAKVVALDGGFRDLEKQRPQSGCSGQNLAYIIYTSGSTGRPKGVCVPHRGVVRLVMEGNYVHFGADEVFLQFAPVSFDASTFEIWGGLLHGAKLVVVPPYSPSLAELGEFIQEFKVTTLWLTAGLFNQMIDDQIGRLKNVRQVFAGGDTLSVPYVRKALEELPDCLVINGYGPTEGTTFTCCHRIRASDVGGSSIPIGRPIANTQVFLLDDYLQPVPIGLPGELYIGGDGLARGYLNRPELTAEKFVVNPFGDQGGGRLYRTGDLCRYLPDGNIEFLGRMDQQVKIRGFRIELGEIEVTLVLHAGVRQTVVVAREEGDGDKRLVAYVVAVDPSSPPGVAELRDFLKLKLPRYMVPAAFVMLEHLPLTSNGKVDRKALPAPELTREPGRQGYVGPRTPTEEALADIWAEVLKIREVGVHDNFFELGGHSLLATQVVARIRRVLAVEVPLRDLFEFPTIAEIAQEFPALQGAADSSVPPLLPALRGQPMPPSFAQQRLWFLDRFEGSSIEYNISKALRLEGDLDREALARAINGIVARHESLRTHFVETEDGLIQVVEPELRIEMPVEDLSALETGLQEKTLAASLRHESEVSFDLSKGPLLRAKLFVLGEREHILLWTCHHIVSDGWSQGVFSLELAALYASFRDKKASDLPELPVQYADYAVWQRGWLQGEELERQLGYWREQLNNPPILELPSDRSRPSKQTYAGAQHSFVLSDELAVKLKAFNHAENITPFMSLMGVFQVLLSRYSGQEDIVVGTPIANRQREELENLIGFFVNTLVLRTDLSGQPSFREVVRRVRRTALDAYQHQDLPFEKLVEQLNPARDLSRHPIFQAMFALQNAPVHPLNLAGLEMSPHRFPAYSTHFDLELHLWAAGETWSGSFSYNTDLFDAATIERMAGHFQRLLESMLAEPERPVSAVPLLTERERHQLLVEWNDTAVDYPRDKCIHQLFEEQVERSPEAVAVVFEKQELSYRELNERANQLAHHLRGMGVGPEVLVGICVERSLEMVVGLLGILKAGGAYVPLDPSYPKERLAFILEDTALGILVTQKKLISLLPATQAKVVALDGGFRDLEKQRPQSGCSGQNLAYIIYTSGSTGRPKGVEIEHRNAVALVAWAHRTYTKKELSGVLASTSICFDLSIFELFVPLTCGGGVVFAQNVLQLPELAAAGRVSLINTVPSGMGELLRFGMIPSSVITVNLAGEPLKASLVREIYGVKSIQKVYDLYGPSEDTTYSTCSLRQAEGIESIGRPLANKKVYILNREQQPVPIGVAGELYVGGAGVARGYLNRPELTAEKFVVNPFGDHGGGRLYKTGDLCRYLADGNIEFLGRMDQQVKIRGFRIELGEIEVTLGLHGGVRQAVVVAREEGDGDRRLVAYVVAEDPMNPPGAGILRDLLKQKLPDYMVPAGFVMLEQIPLTPNGKVDRKALPALELTREPGRQGHVAPRTPTEEELAGIWAEVLKISEVGVHDNFFELGGHSLIAVQVVNRIEKKLSAKLSLAGFFQNATIAQLAALVDGTSTHDKLIRIVTAQSMGEKPPLFCLHFLSSARRLGKYLGHDRKVFGVESPFEEEIQEWHKNRRITISIEELGRRYLAIIREQQPQGPYHLAGFCFGGVLAFEVASQLERQGERVATLALLDAFYAPGCKPLAFGWINRWVFHARQTLTQGANYAAQKLKRRLKIAKQRRSKWTAMRERSLVPKDAETKQLRLPQADFLIQILEPYKGKPYAGNAIVFRSTGEPNSFSFNPGAVNGWDQIVHGNVVLEEIVSNHADLFEEPHVVEVARRLRNYLEQNDANPRDIGLKKSNYLAGGIAEERK